jgi:CubicO group peptidase (beta-lactamase class C family)
MRRSLALAIGLSMVAMMVAVASAPASAHPGQPSVQFDPDAVDWYSYHGKNVTEFDSILHDWWTGGFIPVDIEVDSFSGDLTFGGAAQRNLDGRPWMVDTIMTTAEYATTNTMAVARNMRLVDREMYYYRNALYVGALWVQNTEGLGWITSKFSMTLAELTTIVAQQEHAGRLPIDFDMFATPGGIRYSAVFLDNPEGLDWHLRGDLTYAQFLALDAMYGSTGFRTISIDSATATPPLFGAIWWENANGRSWASRVHGDEVDYDNWWGYLSDQGLRQIFNGRYVGEDKKIHLLSTWRQNGDRLNWHHRSVVDGIVTGEMGVDAVPGVSLAVMENGQFLYKRGFGYADIGNGVWMDSSHVLRTASVAKAIGGALLLKAADVYGVGLGDSARTWVASLPAAYDPVTLEMLASNRGCVRHYSSAETYSDPDVQQAQQDADAQMATNEYAASADALPLYQDDALVCSPGASHYSTYGYGVLGATLEAASGETTGTLVQEQISGPLGLETLRTEDLDDASVNRAKAYDGLANVEIDLHSSQKTAAPLGGGIWSTAGDLCRFGHALVTGQIVDDPDYIWTGTPWTDYAYGWNLGTQNGHQRIAKRGGASGADAYLLAFPDDDIVIAVLINRQRLGDPSRAQNIAEAIGALLV